MGVVVAYHGVLGEDVTGPTFRYGEQVDPGHRGVWKRALPPGKYALNPYAMTVEHVPTVNFVLRWITGMTEEHQYDKDLESIELITADGYEPTLPLSLVLHIDYEKAPRVVQRFGDVKRLISQTLDPILSAYFRDVAQTTNMLDLLTRREQIQARATEELGRRFKDYDINCIAVLIGRPEARLKNGDDPIDRLFDQLRQRRLADEQTETYGRQEVAARKLRELAEAQAAAEKQTQLTQTAIDVQVAANRGEAELAEARRRLAERDVVRGRGRVEGPASWWARARPREARPGIAQTGQAEARGRPPEARPRARLHGERKRRWGRHGGHEQRRTRAAARPPAGRKVGARLEPRSRRPGEPREVRQRHHRLNQGGGGSQGRREVTSPEVRSHHGAGSESSRCRPLHFSLRIIGDPAMPGSATVPCPGPTPPRRRSSGMQPCPLPDHHRTSRTSSSGRRPNGIGTSP